jgi:hypothetical protein
MTLDNSIGPEPSLQFVAAGGCNVPFPYVGDWPYPPYVPQTPYQPGQGSTTTQLFGPKVNKMDVFIIWAIVPDQPDAPWVVGAWDDYSRSENEDGFQEDLAKAEEVYGARFIRVTKTSVNYDKVIAAFEPPEV